MGNMRDGAAILHALAVAATLRTASSHPMALVDLCCEPYRLYPDLEFESDGEPWEKGPVGKLLADAFAPGKSLLLFKPGLTQREEEQAWDEWWQLVSDPWHQRYGWPF